MASTMKYANLDLGTIEAVFNKLGGMEGAQRFLRDETVVSEPARAWREEDNAIYFSVTSRGTTGPQWIEFLEKQGRRVGKYAKSVLLSSDFRPTNGITRNIAVIKGDFFTDEKRITKEIRAEGDSRGWKHGKDINPETACLIREKFTDKEIEAMGLCWIVVMHDPINDSDGNPRLLGALRRDDGSWLSVFYVAPALRWRRARGFAFVVPQV